MPKTSMIAVIGRIMDITRRCIEDDGLCTLEWCRRRYKNVYRLPLGEEFVLDIWYQHQVELEVVYIGGTGWLARNRLPKNDGAEP